MFTRTNYTNSTSFIAALTAIRRSRFYSVRLRINGVSATMVVYPWVLSAQLYALCRSAYYRRSTVESSVEPPTSRRRERRQTAALVNILSHYHIPMSIYNRPSYRHACSASAADLPHLTDVNNHSPHAAVVDEHRRLYVDHTYHRWIVCFFRPKNFFEFF